MLKTIIKEGIILFLIFIVLILVLGVIFYDYIPTSKIIPKKVQAYTTPDNTKKELENTIEINNSEIIKTYTIDSKDLNVYEAEKSYDAGKVNPFKEYTAPTVNEIENTIENNISSGSFLNTVGK